MTCKDLIGYQLVSINDEEIIVRKVGKEELNHNPIITNVESVNSYSSSDSGWCYGACVTVECKYQIL